MIRWTHHPAKEAFSTYAADWDRLNAQLFESHPLFDSRFIGALLDHFSTGNERLCLHHSPSGIDGALILRPNGFGKWTLFLPSQTPIGATLVGDGRLFRSLMSALPGYTWSIDLLALDPEYMPSWEDDNLPRWTRPHRQTISAACLMDNNDRMTFLLKATCNESLPQLPSGRPVLAEEMQSAFSDPRPSSNETYTHATREQLQWTDATRIAQNETLFRHGSIANLYLLFRTACRRLWGRPIGITEHKELATVQLSASVDDISKPCRELLDREGEKYYEFSQDWLRNLQQSGLGENTVRYATLTSGQHGLAVMPFRVRKHGLIRSLDSFSNYYTSLYSPAVLEHATPEEFTRLIAEAARVLGRLDSARFAPMDPGVPSFNALISAFMSNGWIPFRFFCFGNWYLKSPGNWETYLKSRSSNFRSNIKRANKKFLEAGGRLDLFADTANLNLAVAAFQEVYSQSWKKPEPHPDFVPNLIANLAHSGKLRLGVAWLGDEPIAAQIWIANSQSAAIFKVAYNEHYAAFSPGYVITSFLMQHALDVDKAQEVDFLIGDDHYKRYWMSHRRERWGIVAYNPRTLAGVLLLAREVVARLIKSLRPKAKGAL